MDAIPIYDATAPIACTADGDEIRQRIEQIERMRGDLRRIERTPAGLLLHLPDSPDIDAALRQFAVEEKGCCQFWGFAIDRNSDELTLRWEGPPDTADLMSRLHAYFQGDEPLTGLSGLL